MWYNGRQLSAVNMVGTWYYYGYNDEGVRVYKNGGAYYHNYTVDGTRVIVDRWGDNILIYLYDADGSPIGMQYRNVSVTDPEQFYTYWFEKNLQGDIVAIYNESGVKLISYAYDAWGKQVRTIHNSSGTNAYAQYNCLTYRGYFYDQETGLYYLNSRYYNPVTKRFINADGYISTGQGLLGNNMFSYCNNNPVIHKDPNGDFLLTATLGGVAVWKICIIAIGLLGTVVLAESITENPPIIPPISLPKIETKQKSKTKSETQDISPVLPKLKAKDPTHHIVAKADFRARESRQILLDVGIDPLTDPRNLVILPRNFHASMHSNAYHRYVTERLREVAGDEDGIEATLNSLRAEILARSITGIRWT